MTGIFKAYDIRGIYGKQLNETLAHKIGKAFVTVVQPKTVVVGYDMREHSIPLFQALTGGLTEMGADVIDIGLSSTPMSYFANGSLKADASIIITASHNTGEWNGFKLCRADAVPISGATGIKDIEKAVVDDVYKSVSDVSGTVTKHDILPEYIKHIQSYADIRKPIKIAADLANSMGIVEEKVLEGILSVDTIFAEMDGTFPNHEANPLKLETLQDIQNKVATGRYDFGVAFDGDADRVGFVDEKGTVVPMDIITALIAKSLLQHEKGPILYDLRSSWAVKETIEEAGGTALLSRVGHSFIKQQMRDNNVRFAGELSGHYYFRDNYFAESSSLAVIMVANLLSQSVLPLSEMVRPIQRYRASGEINSEVSVSKEQVFDHIRSTFADGDIFELDGITVEFDDWWFNVRASNTEPLIRLNLEAKTEEQMESRRDELLSMIRSIV